MVLKFRSYTKKDAYGRTIEIASVESENSLRDPLTKKLILVPHPFYLSKSRETQFTHKSGPWAMDCESYHPTQQGPVQDGRAAAASQARARLIGKLHYGDASLGVTLGSVRQSRAMILSRLKQARNLLLKAKSFERTAEFKRDLRSFANMPLKDVAKGLADTHLEWIFGWVPLYTDIHSAMLVLAGDLPGDFCRSTGSNVTVLSGAPGSSPRIDCNVRNKSVWSTQVTVENPNLWLLNRLGLINPAVVAWDLVPWSFVVNLFVNVNSVLKSFTDLVGLKFTNGSVTTTTRGVWTCTNANPYSGDVYSFSSHVVRHTTRSLGTPPRPSLTLRAPEFNMSLLLMAGSLVVQQGHRIASKLQNA